MKTVARLAANRKNAKASTGPRTAAGKARAACNAKRHGLAVPTSSHPQFHAIVSQLAMLLAGPAASPSRLELATQVAVAEIDIRRARSVRLAILGRIIDGNADGGSTMVASQANNESQPLHTSGEPSLVIARMIDALPQLTRLNRYERRGRSRRKFALREMDASVFAHREIDAHWTPRRTMRGPNI